MIETYVNKFTQSIFSQSKTVTPFNAEVVRLRTFISHLVSLKDTFVLTPEDFCHPDDWVSKGKMIRPDCEHLTQERYGSGLCGCENGCALVQSCTLHVKTHPWHPYSKQDQFQQLGGTFSGGMQF